MGTVREELSKHTGEPVVINDELQVMGPVSFAELPSIDVSSLPELDTTPSVLNLPVVTLQNTGALNITNFDDGQPGQTIKVLGDGFSTVVDGAFIKTNTGANKLLLADIIYTFTYINTIWYEDE